MAKSQWMDDQKGNFSNGGDDSFDPSNNYIGIRIQQGVPILDRDWNELEDLRRYQEYIFGKYYIGDCSPDGGFRIIDIANNDFTITKGRFLAQGIEVVNKEDIKYSDLKKRNGDKLSDCKWPTNPNDEIWVYLEAWISEVALPAHPDIGLVTCLRHKVEWVVNVRYQLQLDLNKKHYYANLYHLKKGNPNGSPVVKDQTEDYANVAPQWLVNIKLIMEDERNYYSKYIETRFGNQK